MEEFPNEFGQPIPGYEIRDILGSGATSSVYRATQASLGREVAVKVIRRDRTERDTPLKRIEKEAQLLARLSHPNIVHSIDFGEVDGLMYFTMEYVAGKSAKQHVLDRGVLSVREALLIADRVAAALGYAAAHGVTHRDVKPGNILLGKDGSVKLSDFGLARVALDRSLTRDGATLGTPQYMSPEQVRHARRVDLRSDLYSLGATLYHLVTGKPPYDGDSVAEVLHDVMYGRPVPPEQLNPKVPVGLSRVIARLMAKDRGRRYQDVESLRADLAKIAAAGDSDDAVGLSWQESGDATRPLLVRSGVALGAAGLVLLGIVLGVVFFAPWNTDSRPDPAAQEAAILVDVREQWEIHGQSALETMTNLQQLVRDGSLSNVSRVARLDLESSLKAELEERLQSVNRVALKAAAEQFETANLTGVLDAFRNQFERAFQERVGANGNESGWIKPRVKQISQESIAELEQQKQALINALVRQRQQSELELLSAFQGAAGQTGLLEQFEFQQARRRIAEFKAELRGALVSAYQESMAALGMEADRNLKFEDILAGFPGSYASDLENEQFLKLREFDVNEAVRRLQQRLRSQIEQRMAADVRRIQEGARTPADASKWRQQLLGDVIPPALEPEDIPQEPLNWKEAVAEYEATIAMALEDARIRAAELMQERFFSGDSDRVGMQALLEQRDFAAALQWARRPEFSLIEETAGEFRSTLRQILELADAARSRLRSKLGETVEYRARSGVLLRGRLSYDPLSESFGIGSKRKLRWTDLDLAALLELAPAAEIDSVTKAALLFAWGGRTDLEELDQQLPALPEHAVATLLESVRSAATAQLAKEKKALEREAEQAWTTLMSELESENYTAAKTTREDIQKQYQTTGFIRSKRAELRQIDRAIENGLASDRIASALRPDYPNAAAFEVMGDGSIRLLYDFETKEQGKDFNLGVGEVAIEDGALTFREEEMGPAIATAMWGPTLPLEVDRSFSFHCRLALHSPFEQAEPPHFFGVQLGGVCVAFMRPESPVRVEYQAQLNAWEGSLDQFSDHFFDPALGQSEPREGRVHQIGLRRATDHVLEIHVDPKPGPTLIVTLDDAVVYKLDLKGRESSSYCDIRCTSSLAVQSFEFRGVLKAP